MMMEWFDDFIVKENPRVALEKLAAAMDALRQHLEELGLELQKVMWRIK